MPPQHLIELPADTLEGKALLDIAAGISPKITAQVRVVEQFLERLGERAGILRWHDKTT